MSQENTLNIKRVAAELLSATDPETGKIVDSAPLGIAYMKAFEVWRNQSIFTPLKLLEDGGTLTGARTAIYNISNVPKTEDYDTNDWNWSKIPKFVSKELTLHIDSSFKVQRRYKTSDFAALHNRYREGNYSAVVDYYAGLIKNLQLAAAMKRNTLVMENLFDLAKANGVIEIHEELPYGTKLTSYEARRIYVDPIAQKFANIKKMIDYMEGYIGTSDGDYAIVTSFNLYYNLLLAMGVQGSEQAYSSLVNGKLERILGLPIVPVIYLDNKFSVSEQVVEEDGKFKRNPIEVDLTGIDAILFHKNAFAYKFGTPIFEAQKIIGSPDQTVFTHVEYFPEKRMNILGKFCIGFKFDVTYAPAQ